MRSGWITELLKVAVYSLLSPALACAMTQRLTLSWCTWTIWHVIWHEYDMNIHWQVHLKRLQTSRNVCTYHSVSLHYDIMGEVYTFCVNHLEILSRVIIYIVTREPHILYYSQETAPWSCQLLLWYISFSCPALTVLHVLFRYKFRSLQLTLTV